MSEVSKFIPIEGNGETAENIERLAENSAFKVCGSKSNLPVKPSFWSKLKGVLSYDIKVELTPYQQKIEDEVNGFLHQDITWQGFKNFLFQDVQITTGKKSK